MPIRKTPLVTDDFYHVFNCGVAHQKIFLNKQDYERFLQTMRYYHYDQPPLKLSEFAKLPPRLKNKIITDLENISQNLVEIISFVLMPNHFHFLLKQLTDTGISTFISRTTNSYARYFNTKNERIGSLFQGPFKVVLIEDEEQLIHVSRYIHLNPIVSGLVGEHDPFSYPWSSLPDFLIGKSNIVDVDEVLSKFSSLEAYRDFVLDQVDYGKELEQIKHLLLE